MAVKFKLVDEEKERANKLLKAMQEDKKKSEEVSKVSQNVTLPTAKIKSNNDSVNNFSNIRTVKSGEGQNTKSFKKRFTLDDLLPTANGKIIRTGEFRDGYQFGDVSKTFLGTMTDITQDLAAGLISPMENVLDVGANLFASGQNLLGFKNAAERTRNFANQDLSQAIASRTSNATPFGVAYNIAKGTPGKIFNPAEIKYDFSKNPIENYKEGFKKAYLSGETEKFEDSSVLGEKADSAVKMIGYSFGNKILGDILTDKTGTVNVGGDKLGGSFSGGNIGLQIGDHVLNLPTLSFFGGMSGSLQEANSKENVSELERWTKAFSGGTIESFTEGIFGALGVGGNDITDSIKTAFTKKFSTRAGKMLAQLGVEATGEAVEEFLSYAGNYLVDNGIINKLGSADFSSEWDWDDVLEEMAMAFVTTSISSGGSIKINNNSSIKIAEQELGRKLTDSEKVAITQAVIDGTLYEKVEGYKQQDNPTQFDSNEALPTNTQQNSYSNNLKQTMLQEINNSNISQQEKSEMIEALNNVNEVTEADVEAIKQTINNTVNETRNSQNQVETLPTVNEKYSVVDVEPTTRNTAEKFADRFDSKATMNKVVSQLEKITETRNNSDSKGKLNILFDDAVQGNGLIEIDDNGNRTIKLNPTSNKAVEFTLVHELAHDLKGTEGYNTLVDLVKQYNDGNTNYESAFADIKQIYENYYTQNGLDLSKLDVNEEAVNDILGTALGTQEFVNRITQEHRGIAQRIFDWVKRQINIYKSDNKELTKWLYKVQDNFEIALKQQNNLQEGNKLSIITRENGSKYVKVDTDQNIFDGIDEKDYSKIAKMYMQDYLEGNTTLAETEEVNVGNKGISKYTNPKQQTKYITEKMKLSTELKNVLEIAEKVDVGEPTKDTSKYPNWEYYKINFEINGKNFEGLINIGIDKNGNKHFYEINKIHTTSNSYVSTSKSSSTDSINNSIASSKEEVNTTNKYSIQESENNSGSFSSDSKYSVSDLENYEQKKKDAYNKIADEFGGGKNYWEANLDGMDKESAIRMMKRQDSVKNKFIENHEFEKIYKPVEYSRLKTQEMQDFSRNNELTVSKLVNNETLLNEFFDLWKNSYKNTNISEADLKQTFDMWRDIFEMQKNNQQTLRQLKSFERDFEKIKEGATEIVDEYETGKKLENMPEFTRYVESFVNELYGEKPQLSSEELTELAQDTFGTTDNFNVGAYMTPDGKLLNFGENGFRNDHRDISSIGYNMQEFMDAGNIRMKPEGNGFELVQEPTAEQYNTLKEYIDSLNGEVYVEIDIGKNQYDGANYKKGTSSSKVINDLQYYFRNGKFPAKSALADFLYSQTQKGNWNNYLNELDEKLAPIADRTKTYFTAPTAKNNVAERTRNNKLNPTEISNMSKDTANTTPKLNTKDYGKGNKQSNFLGNIAVDSQFLNEDLRKVMSQEENIRYYKGITNEQTLEKAFDSLQKGGEKETLNWFSKNEKNTSAEDVAKGWILLKQYQDAGDYRGAVEVAKKMRQMGTNAGQAVQAYNILSRLTPEGMFYYAQSELDEVYNKMVQGKSKEWIDANQDKFNLTPEETQTILNTMQEVSNMEDGREKNIKLAQIQKLISDKIPPTSGQGIKAWMRISMLFNPKTQVRNVMGNAVVLPVNATSDIFSGALDKLISKKTGVRTTGITAEGLKGYAKGFGKGVFESYDDFRKGINTRNVEGNRFEIGEGKSFKDKGIGKALNRVDNILSFALDVGDRGFYEATFTNSINNQLVLNNTTEVTQDMIEIATNEALQRTWQDSNNYTQAVLSIRNILNKANVRGYGLGDVLIPFAKTPANLTKAIVDYSPVGLAKTLAVDARKFNNSLSNGQYTAQLQHKFVQDVGKGMAGSLLYVLAYGLAKAGIAGGEADDDKDVKNFMKNSLGISSYSIKIGDKSFTYDWAQPVATPLAIMTNYVKYSKDNPDANAIEKAIKAMDIGTEQLLEQSFMESLNTVLNGNGTTLENLSKAVLDLPSRAIPTFSKQIADMVDGTQRTTFEYGKPVESAVNSVKAKIPGLSTTLPASVDTLGNEIQKYGGNNNLWNVMFNPANMNKGQLTKTGEEIYNVYMNTGDTTIFPRTAPYYINSKGEKINMTSVQRNKFQKITGEYVEISLNGLLSNKNYKNLSDEEKAKIINEIVSDSYSKAKYDVLGIDSKEYSKTRETLKDVSSSSYYSYKINTEGLKKDSDKIKVLVDSNYTNKEKTALYENYILSSNDTTYPLLKKFFTNDRLNINKYLEYKTQEFESDKEDDGTVSGKSVSGSKKEKVVNYVDNMDITYNQKLLLLGTQYKLGDTDRTTLANYINNSSLSRDEKLQLYGKLKGFTVYKNGRVSW